MEARLEEHKRKWIAGTNGPTIADFALVGTFFGQLYNERSIWKGELASAVHKVIEEHPYCKIYLTETL